MKPLLRQYFYDKLRRSLYHHELKTKVWNNPYFPFYTKEEYTNTIDNISSSLNCNKEIIHNTFNKCREYIKKNHFSTYDQYKELIKKLDESPNEESITPYIVFNYFKTYNIIGEIEDKYGNIYSNEYRSS